MSTEALALPRFTGELGKSVWHDLQPFPGRELAAARIVVAATVTIILSETLRVPFPDFSAYLVFFVANDDSARSLKLGVAAMAAATLALATAIGIDICFMDAPWFRVAATLLLVGGAVWLSLVLRVAAIGRLLAVLLALNLSLADTIFEPETLTRTTLWLWSVAGLAIGVTVLVNGLIRGSAKPPAQAESSGGGPIVADAFTNPEYLRFSGRVLLALVICEVFLNAVAWPGIRTSLVTCVVTALASVNSRNQKQLLRLIGVSIGGLVGVAATIFVVPNLDSIAGLLTVVAVCTYAFAWVGVGSERISYAGFQMALAFYLVLLPGFTTSVDLTSIRDRFVGVFIGVTAMWFALGAPGRSRAATVAFSNPPTTPTT